MSDLSSWAGGSARQTTSTVTLKPITTNDVERWQTWNIDEIYKGPEFITANKFRYVPKENDLVWDESQGWFKVTHVDTEGTQLSTLKPWEPVTTEGGDEDDMALLGPITRSTSEFIILGIDYAQLPAVAVPDNRLQVKGSTAHEAKVFLGNNIGNTGKVISCQYDNSGNIISNTVDLEIVQSLTGNKNIKVPRPFNVSELLEDGEVCSMVFYDAEGGWIPPAYRMVVQNSSFIKRAEGNTKYVKGVQLLSAYLSNQNPDLLEIPVSIRNIASIEFRARVWYTDNTYKDWTVDGTRVILRGQKEFVQSVVGQESTLELVYYLGDNEQSFMASGGAKDTMQHTYRMLTTDAEGAYAPKFFGYPIYVNDSIGWQMTWWLYNLDRQVAYEVTNKMELGTGSAALEGLNYGVKQRLTYAIWLNTVDPKYKPVRHVQTIDVTLFGNNQTPTTSWTIGFEPGQTPQYGASLKLQMVSNTSSNRTIRVSSGIATYDEWLEQMYYNTKPLYDADSESRPLVPTHFIVYVNSNSQYRFPVSQWNQLLTITTSISNGQLVYIKWTRADVNGVDLQLGISGLICKP